MEVMGTEVKTMGGWSKYASENERGYFDDYCKPGDLVGEDVYEHFLDLLPPRTLTRDMLQVGEPHSTVVNPENGKYQETYATFIRTGIKGVWEFKGNCFWMRTTDADIYRAYPSIRDFLKETYRVKFGYQVTRPWVTCKDGFKMSVQAGEALYCCPRKNLESGSYVSCEVAFPSAKEDLLMEFAEDQETPTDTVYPCVPIEIIDEVIKKHGGFFDGRVVPIV